MKYTYNDMPDKTTTGVLSEVAAAFPKIAVFFQQTHGLPISNFKDMVDTKLPSNTDKLAFYMTFRNQHPEIFV